MIETMEVEARTRGARTIYLVAEECVPFFAKRGYAACGRDEVPAAIVATALVARLSPPATSLMTKQI
jgi:N-acetylglutamate synthase-like GNAT family acetyltransferase